MQQVSPDNDELRVKSRKVLPGHSKAVLTLVEVLDDLDKRVEISSNQVQGSLALYPIPRSLCDRAREIPRARDGLWREPAATYDERLPVKVRRTLAFISQVSAPILTLL